MSAAGVDSGVHHVITPPGGWPRPDLGEVWRYRDLVYYLARRDVAVRYRQTAIGATWAILQPVAFAAVFGTFLTLIGRVPTEGIPYAVFALTGMSVWLFLSTSLSLTATSTVQSANLLSKVYFPRLAIPLAAIVPPIIDFLIALVVLFVAMAIYGVAPSVHIVALPAVFAMALAIALGAGLWLSAIAARYRDVQHVVPFLVQIGLFTSPVLYPLALVPDRWQWLYSLNPLVGVLEGFRWAILGTEINGALLLIPLAAGCVLVVSGLLFFARAQTTFADEL
jgi:lipopolysaccharide transport system permease protein